MPCPSFPCFFWAKENHQKKKDLYPYQTPTIPGKDGKMLKKLGNPRKRNEQGIKKKQGKEGQGGFRELAPGIEITFYCGISVCNQVSNGNSYEGEPGRGKNCPHSCFQDFHSHSKGNQVSLVRIHFSHPEADAGGGGRIGILRKVIARYYGAQKWLQKHFYYLRIHYQLHRPSVTQGFLAGILLCNSGAFWTPIAHVNCLGMKFPIACTSVIEKKQ